MRAANRAHASTANSNGQATAMLGRLIVAAFATLALLLVWRPTLLHAQEAKPAAQEAASKSHVVKAGETLWSLAARYYGDGHQWQNLARRNGIPITDEPPLRVGMRLAVPVRPTVRGAKAAEVAAAPADSTVPKAALAKAGEGTLPKPEEVASRAPAGSLAGQTAGKGNAGATGKAAPAQRAVSAPAVAKAPAAAQDTERANLTPTVGTMMGERTLRRIGLVDQDAQMDSRKASEVVTVFHRDLPDAAEAERRTRAVLRPNTPAPRTAEFEAAPFMVSEQSLVNVGRILARVGSPETSGEAYPQRAIKTDLVELEPPQKGSYKVGDRLVTFVTPTMSAKGQTLVYPTGMIEVVKADAGKPALAKVSRQTGRIEQGQRLLVAAESNAQWVKATKLDVPDISTTVTWLDSQEVMPTLQSFVLVGAGSTQGLKAGDELAIYRRIAKGSTEALVATVRVVRAERDHAATVITRQYQTEISVGMTARRYAKAP